MVKLIGNGSKSCSSMRVSRARLASAAVKNATANTKSTATPLLVGGAQSRWITELTLHCDAHRGLHICGAMLMDLLSSTRGHLSPSEWARPVGMTTADPPLITDCLDMPYCYKQRVPIAGIPAVGRLECESAASGARKIINPSRSPRSRVRCTGSKRNEAVQRNRRTIGSAVRSICRHSIGVFPDFSGATKFGTLPRASDVVATV